MTAISAAVNCECRGLVVGDRTPPVEQIPAQASFPRSDEGRKFEIYGFAQADYVQDFKRVNPAWDDTLRPSRIPTEEGVFGSDGQSIIGVRQSRCGRAVDCVSGTQAQQRHRGDSRGSH